MGTYNWAGYEPSYLSFNGGITALANFSTVSDYGDFAVDALTPNDPYTYLVNGSVQTLTNLDIQLMNVLGFGSTATPPDVTVSWYQTSPFKRVNRLLHLLSSPLSQIRTVTRLVNTYTSITAAEVVISRSMG